MDASDPYDDDGFFDDPDTLQAINAAEAVAVSASQQVAAVQPPRPSQRYHHIVSAPRAGPSPAPFGRRKDGSAKDPAPLNVQPGSVSGGFGWEHGGKRVAEGNIDRNLQAIKDRQAYWSHGHPSIREQDGEDEDMDTPMDIMVDHTGRYAHGAHVVGGGIEQDGEEDDIVDNRHQPISESLAAQSQPFRRQPIDPRSAQIRRAAIAAAMNEAAGASVATDRIIGPERVSVGAARHNGVTRPGPSGPSSTRQFSRSVSAGSHLINRPQPIAGPSRLEPIASQSGPPPSSQGSSQGTAIRKLHLDLEQEKKQREALEREIANLRKDAATHGESSRPLWRNEADAEQDVDMDDAERTAKLKALQLKVYEAEGKVATMERNKQKEQSKHSAEVDKWKANAEALQAQLTAKEKEHKHNLETLKTQAVFNNHAVISSVAKSRAFPSSQRPVNRNGYTPGFTGSPSRKGQVEEATPLVKSTSKGKAGKALPPIPQPGFRALVNAFDAPDTGGRTSTKRPRVDTTSPAKLAQRSPARASQNGLHTPEPSPTKAKSEAGMLIDEDMPEMNDIEVFVEEAEPDGLPDKSPAELKSDVSDTAMTILTPQLLRHLFNYSYICPIRVHASGSNGRFTPALYWIINHRFEGSKTGTDSERDLSPISNTEYSSACASALQTCGDPHLDADGILQHLAKSFTSILNVFSEGFAASTLTQRDVSVYVYRRKEETSALRLMRQMIVLSHTLALLSRTAVAFPAFIDSLIAANPNNTLGSLLKGLIPPANSSVKDEKPPTEEEIAMSQLRIEVGGLLVDLLEVVCLVGDGSFIWSVGTSVLKVRSDPDADFNRQHSELVDTSLQLFALSDEPDVIDRAVDVMLAASCSPGNFRMLSGASTRSAPHEQPLLDCMARYLLRPQVKMTPKIYSSSIKIVRAFSMLAVADPSAVVLISNQSILVLCLVYVLSRESSLIWGINYTLQPTDDSLSLLYSTLLLLHHLVYPTPFARPLPSSSQSDAAATSRPKLLAAEPDVEPAAAELPQGLNLGDRLVAGSHTKEFNGIFHLFQAALGAMAFAPVDLDEFELGLNNDESKVESAGSTWKVSQDDLRSIQYLSQDLLEAAIEGPEVDAMYEIYAGEEDTEEKVENPAPGEEEGVDPDVYAEMNDVSVVE